MMIGSRANAAITLLVLMVAMTAHAQSPEAEALFREGKRLLKAGDITAACEKFEASERIEPAPGTQLNLADCWEQDGRFASAWAMFKKAAASAAKPEARAEARRRATALEEQLVYLTIEVPAEAEVDDLVITRNDTIVDKGLWNQRVPMDPAEYTITAAAPERKDWSTTVKVKTKDKVVVIPELERRPRKKKSKGRSGEDSSKPYGSLTFGLAIGGGVTVAIATGLAIHSKTLADDADELCRRAACTDTHGVDLNHRARLEGWVATVGMSLGAAAIIGAIVLWKKSDKAVSVAPTVTDDGATVSLGGHF